MAVLCLFFFLVAIFLLSEFCDKLQSMDLLTKHGFRKLKSHRKTNLDANNEKKRRSLIKNIPFIDDYADVKHNELFDLRFFFPSLSQRLISKSHRRNIKDIVWKKKKWKLDDKEPLVYSFIVPFYFNSSTFLFCMSSNYFQCLSLEFIINCEEKKKELIIKTVQSKKKLQQQKTANNWIVETNGNFQRNGKICKNTEKAQYMFIKCFRP